MLHRPEDKPCLRPCEPRPLGDDAGANRQIALRDVMGICEGMAVLTPAAYFIAAHFDGQRDIAEIEAALARKSNGARVDAKIICHLADELDRAGFLDSPRFAQLKAKAIADFHAQPLRAPACAGGAYPDDPLVLRDFLDRFFLHADGPGPRGERGSGKRVKALVAPHIDLHRGGPCYAHAYRALHEGEGADLFIVFGTAHASPEHLFTLTRKSYDTPFGPVPTDVEVVNALTSELGEEELFADELVHRSEHSVELQILWLKHLFGDRAISAVPILCSSVDHLDRPGDHAVVRRLMAALGKAVAGRKVCFIAGADLAHVGMLYGDARGPTPEELEDFKRADLETLGFYCRGDAHGFAMDARRGGERRRLCGTSPMFAALLAAGGGAGELLSYGQWYDGTDSVSFCAARVG